MHQNIAETKLQYNVPPMPAPMRELIDNGKKTYIFNVGPQAFVRPMGSLYTFHIPACPEGEVHSKAVEYHGRPGIPSILPETTVDQVEGRSVTYKWDFSTEGPKLAHDIIGDAAFHDSSDNLTKYGVFIASGPVPTEEELAVAHEKLNAHYDTLVRSADQAFEVNGGMETGENGKAYSAITSTHIQAARALGLDRPWARRNVKMVACPACAEHIKPHAIVCNHCDAILDEEKARKFYPHKFAHERQKPGPKPREEVV